MMDFMQEAIAIDLGTANTLVVLTCIVSRRTINWFRIKTLMKLLHLENN